MSTATEAGALVFPSVAWFERLAELMEARRDRHKHLGTIDCLAQFTMFDHPSRGENWHVQVRFEEYSVVEVRQVGEEESTKADFILETDIDVWQEMVQNITAGQGRPDLEHSLNKLSLPGTPIRLWSEDPLARDLFFRYNQSLQEFWNACAEINTTFSPEA
jgi:hypothetical protein